MLPRLGDIWDSKYRIDAVLGEGGMGVVFLAHHLRLDQQVAIKCLLPDLVREVSIVARFEREARAAARLRSRHVVKILDVATAPTGTPYMVMEMLHGRDLFAEAEAQGGTLPSGPLCDWLVQVAGALDEAHRAGIVHRDLKPGNIFLAEEPGERIAKVLDFGIAKSNAIVPGITLAHEGGPSICGTPQYMSPEQITDGDVDSRSDIWAFCVLAYEMLSGRVPFQASSLTGIAVQIVNHEPVHLAELCPHLPAGLADIVMSGLHKSRERRPSSMRMLAEALAPFGTRGTSDLLRWSSSGEWSSNPISMAAASASAPRSSGPMLVEARTAPLISSAPPSVSDRHTLRGQVGRTRSRAPLLMGSAFLVCAVFAAVGMAVLLPRRAPDKDAPLVQPGSSPGVAASSSASVPGSQPSDVAPMVGASRPAVPVAPATASVAATTATAATAATAATTRASTVPVPRPTVKPSGSGRVPNSATPLPSTPASLL
jgi:serine/threonine-protein kinase